MFCCNHTCYCANMVSVMSRYITSVSRYHPRYQSRSSIYIRCLIPRNSKELTEAVPIYPCCLISTFVFGHLYSMMAKIFSCKTSRFSQVSVPERTRLSLTQLQTTKTCFLGKWLMQMAFKKCTWVIQVAFKTVRPEFFY